MLTPRMAFLMSMTIILYLNTGQCAMYGQYSCNDCIVGSSRGRSLCKGCVRGESDSKFRCRRCRPGAELSTLECRGCTNKNPEFGEKCPPVPACPPSPTCPPRRACPPRRSCPRCPDLSNVTKTLILGCKSSLMSSNYRSSISI